MKKLIVLSLVFLMFYSCKKDKDAGTSCKTDIASISGSYKITAYTYKESPSSSEEDYYNILFPDPCERDNVLILNANGTYQLTDAGIACSPVMDDNGIWSLSGNTFTKDGEATTIESFNCKTLVLVVTDTQTSGDKLKITLVKQ